MFAGLDSYEIAFWLCAAAGTTLFVMKTLLLVVGGIDHDLDFDADGGDIGHEGSNSSDVAFKLLSINSITGFFMMFGWVGLACYKQAELHGVIAILAGGVAGFFTMYATAKLFQSAKYLISPGSQFKINETIGLVGSVYQQIPENGSGKIQVTVDGITREINAKSVNGSAIASFTSIEVVAVVNATTVSVRVSQ